mmetsp:Transcript_45039/g.86111  ORF Transcript_45039/g.86111 Transcript_45039/m.86111 type:complete len:231 (-) Transcript_45039:572-1264(-)
MHVHDGVVVHEELRGFVQFSVVGAHHGLGLLKIHGEHLFSHAGAGVVAVKERRFGDEAHNGVVGHGGQPVVPVLQPPGDAWVVPADALHEPPGHEHRGVELVPVRDAHDAKPLGEAPLARHCIEVVHTSWNDVHRVVLLHEVRGALQVVLTQQVVAVQHAQPVPLGVSETHVARVSQASVGLADHPDSLVRVPLHHLHRLGPRVVSAAVVHQHHLPPVVLLRDDALHRLL